MNLKRHIATVFVLTPALSSCGSLFECNGYTETVYVQTQRCTAGYSSTGHCNGWTYGQKPVERCVRTPDYSSTSASKNRKSAGKQKTSIVAKENLSGDLLLKGTAALDKGDDKMAVAFWRQAADKGNMIAQNNLGWAYKEGRGVEPNDVEAVRWYRLSAAQKYADAQFTLGWMYYQGRGVAQSNAEALGLFQLAADQNDAEAQYFVGWMFENGFGTEKDIASAVRWYRKALAGGQERARDGLGRLGASS